MSDDSSYNEKYDPDMPVIRWRQRMELATICVANAISRRMAIRHRHGEYSSSRTSLVNGSVATFVRLQLSNLHYQILLVFPLWTSQIMTNRYGSGLHVENVPYEWAVPFWNWSLGWMAYYIVVSLVKISVCYSLLEICTAYTDVNTELTLDNRAAGCYGIWLNREDQALQDLTWTETIYIMFNSIEITLYTVGGSLTVFSRYFISRAAAYSSGARTNHSHSNSFSIFSKVSNRMRKFSMTESQLNRPEPEEPELFNINATAPLPNWDFDGYEMQQPLPPPPKTAMATLHDPEASKWHSWETSYGVPVSRETVVEAPSIENMGVLPDVDDTPPRTREPSTTRHPRPTPQTDTAWYNSDRSSDEEQPPATPQFFTATHRPSGSRHDSPQQSRKFHLPFQSQVATITYEYDRP
ncbi:hypothetical protein SLS58_002775 [Diplodia intermedia]|uniref:Uncharacterized protein n=1 Tax=Diplodia intermedia TaxID=856260 RepID=A0ABR3TYE3_9PEZI